MRLIKSVNKKKDQFRFWLARKIEFPRESLSPVQEMYNSLRILFGLFLELLCQFEKSFWFLSKDWQGKNWQKKLTKKAIARGILSKTFLAEAKKKLGCTFDTLTA